MKGMKSEGIKLRWATHFNELFTTPEIVELAIETGCTIFFYSPDTGSKKTMTILKKGFTPSDIKGVYRLFRKKKVKVKLNLFFNVPGESFFTFISLLLFIAQVALSMRRLLFFRFTNIRIFPETEIFRMAQKKGIIKKESLLRPKYYDPYPMRVIGFFLHLPNRIALIIRKIFKKDLWFGM
jgi:radical SAM superfamily enzyme YgiQ (UPF0313 family)